MLGGRVTRSRRREYGRALLKIDERKDVFRKIPARGVVWMSHGDRIIRQPSGFAPIAHTDNSPIAAMADRKRKFFALQFHPEVAHTEQVSAILKNFIFHVCRCRPLWTMGSFIDSSTLNIREIVGKGSVVCAISGGVDSAVTAVLMHRAVRKRLTCIFVDNGVLRTGEA
jgi:GMP synthase (glutamine-hydrolysing)